MMGEERSESQVPGRSRPVFGVTADRRPRLNPLVGRTIPSRITSTFEADVRSVHVLDETEASRVAALVNELRPYWRIVGKRLSFFTLGAASYIDAARSRDEYRDLAFRLNPILVTHFSDLYARLLAALRDSLGLPVTFAEGLALPGFHLYQYHPELAFLQPQVHKDLQHHRIDWSFGWNSRFRSPTLVYPRRHIAVRGGRPERLALVLCAQ